MHLAAYKLIRQTLAIAAARAGVEPWTISFKGTVQTLVKLLPLRATKLSTDAWCDVILDVIATHIVGNRPVPRRTPPEEAPTEALQETA